MTKILLVEDDKSLREIYGVRLLAEGYDIVSAGDGEEALAMAIKERPELIVSDVMMPKISGFDMLDILRSTTETKDIKVIMMTALSSEDQRARGQALGADRYLVKSQVGIEDVVRTVHDVLGDAPVANRTAAQTFAPIAPAGVRPTTPVVPPRPAIQPQQQVNPIPTQPPIMPSTPPAASYLTTPIAPQPQASGLPQPTAPFSTTRPVNLGERIIHPITPQSGQRPDMGKLMDQELSNVTQVPVPAQQAITPPQPAVSMNPPQPPVMSQPVAPTPIGPPVPQQLTQQQAGPEISFEETPRQPSSYGSTSQQ